VLFIGTRFSNLYTAVDTPAEAALKKKCSANSTRVKEVGMLSVNMCHNMLSVPIGRGYPLKLILIPPTTDPPPSRPNGPQTCFFVY
jgi:hypothetical protein